MNYSCLHFVIVNLLVHCKLCLMFKRMTILFSHFKDMSIGILAALAWHIVVGAQ